MTSWLLSIVGVVFLGVMIDVIAPSGKTNSIIKTMFAIMLIYVVLSPIISLIGTGDLNDWIDLGL